MSQFKGEKFRRAWLLPWLWVLQGQSQRVAKVAAISGGSGDEPISKLFQLADETQFPVVVGLRSLLFYWLLQRPLLAPYTVCIPHHTAPSAFKPVKVHWVLTFQISPTSPLAESLLPPARIHSLLKRAHVVRLGPPSLGNSPYLKLSQFSSVQLLGHVWLFVTPWTAACQASLSITNSQSLLKFMSIESVMPSNHLILCWPFLLLPWIFPSIRVFPNESVLHIRWPKYSSFSFSISPSNESSGFISFRIDWFDLLPVQGTLKSLYQHHSLKASVLQGSAFFMVQVSHDYWKNYWEEPQLWPYVSGV